MENLDQSTSSFKSPNWVGTVFHFFEGGKLAMENQQQVYVTDFAKDGQSLSYSGSQFEMDRHFKDYFTFLFVDEVSNLNCRLHFVPASEAAQEIPERSARLSAKNFPILGSNAPSQKGEAPIYKVVEQMPRFPGCEDEADEQLRKECAQQELLKYIYKNLSYPEEARTNETEGTVVITFVVSEDGTVTDAKIVREIGDGCGAEALRVVNEMPTQGIYWIPGKQRGNPVRVQFNLPIKFKLP